MRFAEGGLYIERYEKCANCGVLLYEEDDRHAGVEKDGLYCSTWCVEWARERAGRAENVAPRESVGVRIPGVEPSGTDDAERRR